MFGSIKLIFDNYNDVYYRNYYNILNLIFVLMDKNQSYHFYYMYFSHMYHEGNGRHQNKT